MRLSRKIVTAGVSVACGLALAACGQQVVAHVSAADTVHSALTGVFSSPTTRFDITEQNLPGVASLIGGSFSVVVTTSNDQNNQSVGDRAVEVSVYEQSTDLADILAIGGSAYVRVDMKGISALAGPTISAEISSELGTLETRPGLGFLSDLSLGKWVGVSKATYDAVSSQLLDKLPSLPVGTSSSSLNASGVRQEVKAIKQLTPTIGSSFVQSVQTWLSINKKTTDEYSAELPVRPFVASLVNKLEKPVEAALKISSISAAEVSKSLAEIPADLSLRANLWIESGSLTKVQAFIPRNSTYLLIGVSHPATALAAPSDATMLTGADLTALYEDLMPVASKIPAINLPGISSVLPTSTTEIPASSSAA